MPKRSGPGVRCVNCGCRLDPDERCDCEERENQMLRKQALRKLQLAERNKRLLERAFDEFDCC